jgi:hypothetical protein
MRTPKGFHQMNTIDNPMPTVGAPVGASRSVRYGVRIVGHEGADGHEIRRSRIIWVPRLTHVLTSGIWLALSRLWRE